MRTVHRFGTTTTVFLNPENPLVRDLYDNWSSLSRHGISHDPFVSQWERFFDLGPPQLSFSTPKTPGTRSLRRLDKSIQTWDIPWPINPIMRTVHRFGTTTTVIFNPENPPVRDLYEDWTSLSRHGVFHDSFNIIEATISWTSLYGRS